MNRQAASAYLTTEYQEMAADSQLDPAALASAYASVIDTSLRKLGYAESALATADVPGEDMEAYCALLDYYALRRFVRAYAPRTNVSVGSSMNVQRAQAFEQAKRLADEAAALCAALGYPVDAAGTTASMTLGFLNLDFLEPSSAESEF